MVASGAASAGAHEIADLHIGLAHAAGNRRADFGEVELNLQILQRRAIGFRGRARDIDLRLGVVERDQCRGVLGDEFAVTLHVALGLFELRLRAVDHRLRRA